MSAVLPEKNEYVVFGGSPPLGTAAANVISWIIAGRVGIRNVDITPELAGAIFDEHVPAIDLGVYKADTKLDGSVLLDAVNVLGETICNAVDWLAGFALLDPVAVLAEENTALPVDDGLTLLDPVAVLAGGAV